MNISSKKNSALYLDCASGISGDMMVAALIDLGADAKLLTETLASLPLEGYRIEISSVFKSGLKACDFNVILDEHHENHDHDMEYLHGVSPDASVYDAKHLQGSSGSASVYDTEHLQGSSGSAFVHDMEHPQGSSGSASAHDTEHLQGSSGSASVHDTEHLQGSSGSASVHDAEHLRDLSAGASVHADHAKTSDSEAAGQHHHHHHGRNLADITDILKAGSLTPHALELALRIFQIVAEAESQVHGKPLEEVHFHEVGAVDSIIDIAAAAICMDNLEINQVIIPSLTEGCGQIRCQHGLLPIPVPATAAIVSSYQLPLHISSVRGELVTPTGAAIAAALRTQEELPEKFKILRTGLGAGKRTYETAGVLRAMLIEDAGTNNDRILMIETNMDDCTGEAMGFVTEELLEAGALDAFYTPIYMKKHRPAYQLSVLCTPQQRQTMEALIFRHTTTIGLRAYEVERTKLPRKIISLETPWGMADIKCCQFQDETYFYPESDSIIRLCHSNQGSFSEMYYKVKEYAEKNSPIL